MAFIRGIFTDKPEFVAVLANKQVEFGEKIFLSCEVNIRRFTATWKKNGEKLDCVHGKHKIIQSDKLCSLEIQNAREDDEGNYTIEVSNSLGSVSCSAMVTVALKKWREILQKPNEMEKSLRNFKIHSNVKELRFLLHGPVGSGKSSLINTIKSIFEKRPFLNCLTGAHGESFTLKYQKFLVGSDSSGRLPFAFYDVMGLEQGPKKGARTDDIISALKGHVPDDYKFQEDYPLNEDNKYYISKPTLNEKIHCLVSVLPADKISLMDDAVIDKMMTVRKAASELEIPQILFMTRVDEACQMTGQNVSKIYQSKKIKEKMQECSNRLGVPLNCVFPVKNYHNETEMNEEINLLILAALTQIVHSANDYVERCCSNEKTVDNSTAHKKGRLA